MPAIVHAIASGLGMCTHIRAHSTGLILRGVGATLFDTFLHIALTID